MLASVLHRRDRRGARGARGRRCGGPHVSPRYDVITGWISPARLQALAQAPGVRFVQEVLAPFVGQTEPAGGAVAAVTPAVCSPTISEGDSQLKADQARFTFGVDGTNV